MADNETEALYVPSPVTREWLLGCESVGVTPEAPHGVYVCYPGGRDQFVEAADIPLAMKLLHAIIAEGLFAKGGLVDAFGTTTWFYDRTPHPHAPVVCRMAAVSRPADSPARPDDQMSRKNRERRVRNRVGNPRPPAVRPGSGPHQLRPPPRAELAAGGHLRARLPLPVWDIDDLVRTLAARETQRAADDHVARLFGPDEPAD